MFTTTAKDAVMDGIFGGAGSALPTSFEVALSTTTPNADGSNITEPDSSTGYGRVALSGFGASSGGTVVNDQAIEFPSFTADAGVATHYVLFDQNGNPYWFDQLKNSRHLEVDTVLAFAANAIQITLNDLIA